MALVRSMLAAWQAGHESSLEKLEIQKEEAMTGVEKLIAKWRKDAAIPCCDTRSGHEDSCRCKGLEACADELESLIPEIAALTEKMKCGHPKVCWQECPNPDVCPCGGKCTACEHERLAVAAALREVFDSLSIALKAAQPENMNLPQFIAGLQQAMTIVNARIPPADRSALDAYVQEKVDRAREEEWKFLMEHTNKENWERYQLLAANRAKVVPHE